MFGLDTIFILGYAVLAGAAAAGNRNRDRNNDYQYHEQLHYHHPTPAPSYSPSSSSNSSSIHTTHTYFEKRTIYDWGCNGLTGEERQILLSGGYNDTLTRYTLNQLKDEIKYRERNLLTEESQTYIQIGIDENGYSSGEEKRSKRRVSNPPKKQSPVGKGMKYHGRDKYGRKVMTNGKTGSDKRLYQWDRVHNDIEVYSGDGKKHFGTMDPRTGVIYKLAQGYKISF